MTFQPTSLALHNACPVLPSDKDIGFYHYATVDTAAVLAAGYFNAVRDKLHVNDVIRVAADDGYAMMILKVTAAPLKPADGNVTVSELGGGVAPGALTAFSVVGGLANAVVSGKAAAGTAKVDVYKVAAGQPVDRAGPRQVLIPAADGTFGYTEGDTTLANIFAGAPTLGRQWGLSAGKYLHANANFDNRVMTSLDGINWSSGTVPTDAAPQTWSSVCWSPELGLFCAVASAGGTNTAQRIMTSPDGLVWTIRTAATGQAFQSVAWGGPAGAKLFVVVSSTTSVNHIQTSPDGITWTIRPTTGNTNLIRSVCWSPDRQLFVAVCSTGTGNRAFSSPDGITWTAETTPADLTWTSVCWAGAPFNRFVAVASTGTGRVMTSPDGHVWTLQAVADADLNANQWTGICWSPERATLVAVSVGGGNRVARSLDGGVTWTTHSGANIGLQMVCWAAALGLFVTVGTTGTTRVYTSPDGMTWTFRPNSPADNTWFSVAWSPALGRFVAVGNANGINPELLVWPGLAIQSGERIRYSFTLNAGTVTRISVNPSRNVGSAFTTAGPKVSTAVISTPADAFGLCANTDAAADIQDFRGFKDKGTGMAQGLYDYHAFPASFSGKEGPSASVLNVVVT